MKISWFELRTIASILDLLNIGHCLSSTICGCILTFFGHVSRRKDEFIEHLIVQDNVKEAEAAVDAHLH